MISRQSYRINCRPLRNTAPQDVRSYPVLAGGGGVTLFAEAEEEGFVVGGKKSATFTGDILIDDLELEELWDSAFGGGLISQDFNTWYKGNIGNGTYTITEENGVSWF